MYSQLLAEFIPIINNDSIIMRLLSPLAHYHTIYLIIRLPRINLTFNGSKIVLSLLNLSLTPFQLFQEFLTSLLLLNTIMRLMLC